MATVAYMQLTRTVWQALHEQYKSQLELWERLKPWKLAARTCRTSPSTRLRSYPQVKLFQSTETAPSWVKSLQMKALNLSFHAQLSTHHPCLIGWREGCGFNPETSSLTSSASAIRRQQPRPKRSRAEPSQFAPRAAAAATLAKFTLDWHYHWRFNCGRLLLALAGGLTAHRTNRYTYTHIYIYSIYGIDICICAYAEIYWASYIMYMSAAWRETIRDETGRDVTRGAEGRPSWLSRHHRHAEENPSVYVCCCWCAAAKNTTKFSCICTKRWLHKTSKIVEVMMQKCQTRKSQKTKDTHI